MYAEVNVMFGDIVKVTPTSKVVGDMALFMVANNLTPADTLDEKRELAFPESVVEFFEGKLGQPVGGFPAKLQERVLKGRIALTERPGASLPPADIEATRAQLEKQFGRPFSDREVVTNLLYPRVYAEFLAHEAKTSDISVLPTPVFFYGMEKGDEISADIEPGKTLIVKFLSIGDAHPDGHRLVFFELNGQPREVSVVDKALAGEVETHPKAEPGNAKQIGAPMPGLVVRVDVVPGEEVAAGKKLVTLEAMKMETTVYAQAPGKIAEILVRAQMQIESGDLMIRFE
jgi:pyruvate carboxylase